jgi:hypothetical protein
VFFEYQKLPAYDSSGTVEMSKDPAGNIHQNSVHLGIPALRCIGVVVFGIDPGEDIRSDIESKNIVGDAVQTMHNRLERDGFMGTEANDSALPSRRRPAGRGPDWLIRRRAIRKLEWTGHSRVFPDEFQSLAGALIGRRAEIDAQDITIALRLPQWISHGVFRC